MGRIAGRPSDGHDPVSNASHRENRRLRRTDNRAESIDLIHAEVADSESCTCNIGRT